MADSPPLAPAAGRAEGLLTRVIATLKPLSLKTRVTLRASEIRLVVDTLEEARQEVRSLRGVSRDPIPAAVRRHVIDRASCRCQQCGTDLMGRLGDQHVDHVIPVARFGSSTLDNLQLLCGSCNREKGARAP